MTTHKMTPAEMKTIRESLGLSAQWVANQAGVKLRTVQYWESGRNAVPDDVAQMLIGIDGQLWGIVAQAVDQIRQAADEAGALPEQLDLIRYRKDEDLWHFQPEFSPLPATCHAMLLSRLIREIEPLKIPVRIIYMQSEKYILWLDGQADSADLRAEWASEQEI
ncbi:MAG: DUF1870 family protein [Advenella sp.]|uniref:Aca2/YdiL-like domain-containing protein n=1 Tax=Advenella sp. TaxID=1872388 RepID=UPI00258464FA|nr:DUF1870 family protein [Advenella sp.]MDD3757721.1 DUF1870 family protein [Advenella sp.]